MNEQPRSLRDELARVVAERRAANPRNEPGHVDYGIADAVLPFIEEARREERARVTRIIREEALTRQGTHPVALLDYRDRLLVALGVEEEKP
jgi:hypothetical protein